MKCHSKQTFFFSFSISFDEVSSTKFEGNVKKETNEGREKSIRERRKERKKCKRKEEGEKGRRKKERKERVKQKKSKPKGLVINSVIDDFVMNLVGSLCFTHPLFLSFFLSPSFSLFLYFSLLKVSFSLILLMLSILFLFDSFLLFFRSCFHSF